MPGLRIVFLGSDAIALPLLEWIAGTGAHLGTIVAAYTQPDRPSGRGQKIQPNAIKAWALRSHLPVLQPEKLADGAEVELAQFAPDLALVMAYGHLLRDPFIETPRLGTLNLHASILPYYRGASPIQTAVACGERQTGVTLMRIVRALDAGPVADVERLPIGPLDTALDVETKMAQACVLLIARTLKVLADGNLLFTDQDASRATYCRRLVKEDGVLDFAAPAAALAARINGLFPWPGSSFEVSGHALRVGLAEALPASGVHPPGSIVGADSQGLLVAAGEGIVRMRKLQRAGGKMLAASEFLRGSPISPGAMARSQAMPNLVSAVPFR